jgi:hypothetical protein
MIHRDSVLSPPSRRLHVVTFTGAHGVGKTTLVADIAESLKRAGAPVLTQHSISDLWFRAEQSHRVQDGLEPLTTYDDINRLGLREKCQRDLVSVLKNYFLCNIGNVLIDLRMFYKAQAAYLLCDRWFSDIFAYTEMECKDPAFVEQQHQQIRQTASQVIEKAMTLAVEDGFGFAVTNVFIPLASCDHIAQDAKPNRGTCDPVQWEVACRRILPFVTIPEHVFIPGVGDRRGRERQLFERLVG